MIITSNDELYKLEIGERIYVAETPKMVVNSKIFDFNLKADITIYYPFNVFKRIQSDEKLFERIDSEHKDGYTFPLESVYEDLNNYAHTYVHSYIVATSERELMKSFRKTVIEFESTAARALEMSKRFKKDILQSKLFEVNQIQYPEDWL